MKNMKTKVMHFVSIHTPFNWVKCPEFTVMQYHYTIKGSPNYGVLTVVFPHDSRALYTFDGSSIGEGVTICRVWRHFNTCPRNDQKNIRRGYDPCVSGTYLKGGNYHIIPRNEMRVVEVKP